MKEVRENTEKDVVFILVGNKIDLTSQREVSHEEAFSLKNEINVKYFETSIYQDTIPSHGKTIE